MPISWSSTHRGPGPVLPWCRRSRPHDRGRWPTWPAIPVALARDLATFRDHGLVLAELVALDLFPTTHHVECVAKLVPQ